MLINREHYPGTCRKCEETKFHHQYTKLIHLQILLNCPIMKTLPNTKYETPCMSKKDSPFRTKPPNNRQRKIKTGLYPQGKLVGIKI